MIDLLLADYENSGEMPPALRNRPELPSHLHCYHNAYLTLRNHRVRNESGYEPLRYQDLILYAKIHGYRSMESLETFTILVQACDHAFLEYTDEKQRQALSKIKAKS